MTFLFQRCLFASPPGGEPRRVGLHVRHQGHRQEGAQGQGGLAGERDQSAQKVKSHKSYKKIITHFKQ